MMQIPAAQLSTDFIARCKLILACGCSHPAVPGAAQLVWHTSAGAVQWLFCEPPPLRTVPSMPSDADVCSRNSSTRRLCHIWHMQRLPQDSQCQISHLHVLTWMSIWVGCQVLVRHTRATHTLKCSSLDTDPEGPKCLPTAGTLPAIQALRSMIDVPIAFATLQ